MCSKYCIDTSALLDAWLRWYPPDIFPGLWDKLDQLINESRLIATEEVFIELSYKEDLLFEWAGERQNKLFFPLDDQIQIEVTAILTEFPKLVDQRPGKGTADPFVIALAKITNATVVTGELPTNNLQRPKIPDVCNQLNIQCIKITELIRMENWSFT